MRRRIRPPRFRGPGVGRGPRDRRGGEIVDPELGVGLVLGEDVPGDHEDGVGDRKNPLVSPRLPKRRRKRWYCAPRGGCPYGCGQAASTITVRSAVSPLRARPEG